VIRVAILGMTANVTQKGEVKEMGHKVRSAKTLRHQPDPARGRARKVNRHEMHFKAGKVNR